MTSDEFVKSFLESNTDFRNNLKDGSESLLAEAVEYAYAIREGNLVNTKTNTTVNSIPSALRQLALDKNLLRSRREGRYLPRFKDRRDSKQRDAQHRDTLLAFETYLNKRAEKYVADEPLRLLKQWVGNSLLYESDGNGSAVFALLMNGVVVERYTPDQLLARIAPYVDQSKTTLSQMRQEQKFRDEALSLSGVTLSDFNQNAKLKAVVLPVIDQLKTEYYAIPTNKKLPEYSLGELAQDVKKECAYDRGYPMDESAWTLQQKIQVESYANNAIDAHKRNSWTPLLNVFSERTPEFYKSVVEKQDGLEYPGANQIEYNAEGQKVQKISV